MSITTIILIITGLVIFIYYKFAYSYLSANTLAKISVSLIFITVGIQTTCVFFNGYSSNSYVFINILPILLLVSLFISAGMLFTSLTIMMRKYNNDKENYNYESEVLQEVKEGDIKVTISKESPKP